MITDLKIERRPRPTFGDCPHSLWCHVHGCDDACKSDPAPEPKPEGKTPLQTERICPNQEECNRTGCQGKCGDDRTPKPVNFSCPASSTGAECTTSICNGGRTCQARMPIRSVTPVGFSCPAGGECASSFCSSGVTCLLQKKKNTTQPVGYQISSQNVDSRCPAGGNVSNCDNSSCKSAGSCQV